jgi:hypothetical protein
MESSNVITPSNRINRLLYVAFIIAGILHVAISRHVSDALMYFGIALCFDPFDQKVKWDDRALYQKIWLCVHLALVLTFVVYFIF